MAMWGRSSVRWLGVAATLTILAVACARSNSDDSASTTDNDLDSPQTSASPRPSTSPEQADTPPSAPETSKDPVDTTLGTSDPTAPTTIERSDAEAPDVMAVASITELIERGDTLIGRTVELKAKAFFLEECPPPDATAAGPCSLLLFIGDADRVDLLYGERDLAVPGFVDGARVTCEVGPDTRTACADWEQGAPYEIVGTVRQPEFGPGVEIDISKRDLTFVG